jgi:NAD(P)-dependent dehydrogenase (short-subunit alcohol dehydrogenase family)
MTKELTLSGKVALITGASSGIGYEIARTFAESGSKVVINGRNQKNLDQLSKVISNQGGEVVSVKADLLANESAEICVKKCMDEFGQLDIVVHCAGITVKNLINELDPESWDLVMATNLRSAFLLARQSWKFLKRPGKEDFAKFIVIGSVGTFLGIPLSSAYSASKGGLVQMVKSVAVEWAGQNININAICPGYIRTPLSESVLKIGETYQKVVSRIPMGRIGEPVDIANAALFLASQYSNYITGTTLNVDGGLINAAYTLDQ